MPLYVSFRRALHGHTTIWYELLEEEKVGHGGCHEVTGGVYKHITASAQRRLSIERVGIKDGAFLVTFGKGAIGRARSEGRSTFISKLMHEHLATEARQEMWAGRAKGSVTCGCGCVLSWAAPNEVGRLQWHILECGLPGETAIRARWYAAVRAALAKRIKRRDVVDCVMAFWATTAGRVHTAAGDQSRGWCAPPMVEEADSGSWFPDPAAPPPCFGSSTCRSGAGGGGETDSDGDEVQDKTPLAWPERASRACHCARLWHCDHAASRPSVGRAFAQACRIARVSSIAGLNQKTRPTRAIRES